MNTEVQERSRTYAAAFAGLDRPGPRREETTAPMLRRVRPFLPKAPRIADMGCGNGTSAVDMAQRPF